MEHLIRVGTHLYTVPEEELWKATVDYGPITQEEKVHLFGPDMPHTDMVWVNAAEYLRRKGF